MDTVTRLRDLAMNLWWSWNPHTIALFQDLDPALWRKVNHNPLAFLAEVHPERLERRATEMALEARINFAFHRLAEYLEHPHTWGRRYAGPLRASPIAYFSAEFGLHESLPVYSGGLGVLAGDHLKSASDLDIPVAGVGLLYAQGYFNQRLDAKGWQQESYREADIAKLPITPVVDRDGRDLRIRLDTSEDSIYVGVWEMKVGRISLYLLDSDVEENTEENRSLTGRLYGGDLRMRIRQELVLGVGGMRALAAVGIRPAVLHLNEGHCVFATLEGARQEMASDGVDFGTALRRMRAKTVFTTHTPVEAGHDRFDVWLMDQTLAPLRQALGLSADALMRLGRIHPDDLGELFCLTVLGFRTSRFSNAVSALHGRVTREMWHGLWPNRSELEVPIGHITNGVHVSSWIASPMERLFDTYLGKNWTTQMHRPETWSGVRHIEDDELWEAHQIIKTRLVSYVQAQVCDQEAARDSSGAACELAKKRLDPSVLTIGFAKRFATYKRADLLLSDDKRLETLVTHPERPIQIIFAGKAHPNNDPAKRLIERIFEMAHDSRFMGRIVFLEDYDINVGRRMVQGVDVWLNAPRRPQEACGTSGMKAIFNGVLNLAVLDGWWAEAYDGRCGFAFGDGREHVDEGQQYRLDAASLYTVLEREVIPAYYEKDAAGIPRTWVARMKDAIEGLAWRFNADRMVLQYARECYLPIVGAEIAEFCDGCTPVA